MQAISRQMPRQVPRQKTRLALALAVLALCTGCQDAGSARPAANSLIAKVPDLFRDDHQSYVVLVKHDANPISAEQRLLFDGIGPITIAAQEVIVWKVAPGIHNVAYGARQGDKALRFEVFDGSRVVFEVEGSGALYMRSFASDRAGLAQNTTLSGFHDMSAEAPPEPNNRRNR